MPLCHTFSPMSIYALIEGQCPCDTSVCSASIWAGFWIQKVSVPPFCLCLCLCVTFICAACCAASAHQCISGGSSIHMSPCSTHFCAASVHCWQFLRHRSVHAPAPTTSVPLFHLCISASVHTCYPLLSAVDWPPDIYKRRSAMRCMH